MADSEESASLLSSNEIVKILEQDEDTSVDPLLSPSSAGSYPETSTAKRPKRQEQEEESHKLRQLRFTALYIEGAADVVLRASAVVLTLVALVLTAMNRKDYAVRRSSNVLYLKFFLSGYILSVNLVVCVYSLSVLGSTIFHLINCSAQGSNNLLFLTSIFQLDQTFAYLLISSSTNTFGCIGTLKCYHYADRHGFCERALASAIVSLLAFFTMATASLISGFRLAAKIHNRSHNFQLALCMLMDDVCEDDNSPASKLLP